MTPLVGGLVEAWDELRLHKLRVLLSLIGVAIAVMAMTTVTAVVGIMQQSQQEIMESQGGREASLTIGVYPGDLADGAMPDPDFNPRLSEAFAEFVERYQIRHSSRVNWSQIEFRTSTGSLQSDLRIVDVPYGVLHRVNPHQGRWFTTADEDRLAPALVVNDAFLAALGHHDLSRPVTVSIGGENPATFVVVGTLADDWPDTPPSAFMLTSAYEQWGANAPGGFEHYMGAANLEIWVPPDQADAAEQFARRDLAGLAGSSGSVDVWRMDQYGQEDYFQVMRLIGQGISALVLGLAALNLVNIAMVTMRQRIREIGIRRAFGATSIRIFFAVMMESVVATVLAGVIGVAGAIVLVANLPTEVLSGGWAMQEVPGFPLSAAIVGLASATVIGMLAGLLPSLVAVRVRPIDAIRY